MSYRVGSKVKIVKTFDPSFKNKIGIVGGVSNQSFHGVSYKLNIDGKKGSWACAWLHGMLKLMEDVEYKVRGDRVLFDQWRRLSGIVDSFGHTVQNDSIISGKELSEFEYGVDTVIKELQGLKNRTIRHVEIGIVKRIDSLEEDSNYE